MSRRKGRILAFQSLYSYDVGGVELDELLKFQWLEKPENESAISNLGEEAEEETETATGYNTEENKTFASLIVSGTIQQLSEIDEIIKSHLSANWSFDRLNKVTLAILRMSIYCIKYQKDVDSAIVIDEAIAIAKSFGEDESYKFINAILDKISREQA